MDVGVVNVVWRGRTSIVFKPDPVIDSVIIGFRVKWVDPGQPKKNPYYIHLINNKISI
jgi:hypothetical protein